MAGMGAHAAAAAGGGAATAGGGGGGGASAAETHAADAIVDVSTAPLPPLVFQCRACRLAVGDSMDFDCSVRSLSCVALTGESFSLSFFDAEKLTSPGVFFFSSLCQLVLTTNDNKTHKKIKNRRFRAHRRPAPPGHRDLFLLLLRRRRSVDVERSSRSSSRTAGTRGGKRQQQQQQ